MKPIKLGLTNGFKRWTTHIQPQFCGHQSLLKDRKVEIQQFYLSPYFTEIHLDNCKKKLKELFEVNVDKGSDLRMVQDASKAFP